MARAVEAVFYDRALKRNVAGRVKIPAGGGGTAHAAKLACSDYAWDNGYSHWAHKDPVTSVWMIFRCHGRSNRTFLAEAPTMEAAEMWMVHRA